MNRFSRRQNLLESILFPSALALNSERLSELHHLLSQPPKTHEHIVVGLCHAFGVKIINKLSPLTLNSDRFLRAETNFVILNTIRILRVNAGLQMINGLPPLTLNSDRFLRAETNFVILNTIRVLHINAGLQMINWLPPLNNRENLRVYYDYAILCSPVLNRVPASIRFGCFKFFKPSSLRTLKASPQVRLFSILTESHNRMKSEKGEEEGRERYGEETAPVDRRQPAPSLQMDAVWLGEGCIGRVRNWARGRALAAARSERMWNEGRRGTRAAGQVRGGSAPGAGRGRRWGGAHDARSKHPRAPATDSLYVLTVLKTTTCAIGSVRNYLLSLPDECAPVPSAPGARELLPPFLPYLQHLFLLIHPRPSGCRAHCEGEGEDGGAARFEFEGRRRRRAGTLTRQSATSRDGRRRPPTIVWSSTTTSTVPAGDRLSTPKGQDRSARFPPPNFFVSYHHPHFGLGVNSSLTTTTTTTIKTNRPAVSGPTSLSSYHHHDHHRPGAPGASDVLHHHHPPRAAHRARRSPLRSPAEADEHQAPLPLDSHMRLANPDVPAFLCPPAHVGPVVGVGRPLVVVANTLQTPAHVAAVAEFPNSYANDGYGATYVTAVVKDETLRDYHSGHITSTELLAQVPPHNSAARLPTLQFRPDTFLALLLLPETMKGRR
ncbi:hypothetical protein C8F04DRAFT_1196696 [Mycena alexandri]|uniref:Uncharacterized protein n=1 Tax=Mycena alexandri TaxID=1745969 RepID=A0AAD6S5T4_9AGAR|nr:hypothetical protein C8F04DRAFT_1196696 [Mycena alexandri]